MCLKYRVIEPIIELLWFAKNVEELLKYEEEDKMSDELVVDRGRSRYGLHLVHVLRAGEPVDREAVIGREVPAEATDCVTLEYEEEELGMHHLQLYWKEKGAQSYDGWFNRE